MSLAVVLPLARLRQAWPLVVGLSLAGLMVVVTLFATWQWPQPTEQLQSDLAPGEILPGVPLGQTFVARFPSVDRVDVMLATYARQNSGLLIFHLKRSPEAAEDLATVTIDAASVQDNAFRSFEFSPLANSPGEQLYFWLEAPQASPGNALTVWGCTCDGYDAGRAVLAAPLDTRLQDVAFRVHYEPTLVQSLSALAQHVTNQKPGLFGQPVWYLTLGLAYLGLLVWLGWLVASSRG